MIIALSIILALTVLYLLAALVHIKAIQKELQALGKEQHTQNKDIIDLLKYRNESTEMLLQHIEILKYLCDKDPILSKTRKQYVGPVGEA
jgi:TRAP-type uncharacterized transport system fused permease subunit